MPLHLLVPRANRELLLHHHLHLRPTTTDTHTDNGGENRGETKRERKVRKMKRVEKKERKEVAGEQLDP
jgi:hypothetical protein